MLMDSRQKGWLWVENDLVDREDLTIYEKMVYITLVRFSDKSNLCFPSYKTIAKKVGCTDRTVKKVVKSLIEKGFICKQNRKRKLTDGGYNDSNVYLVKSILSNENSSLEEVDNFSDLKEVKDDYEDSKYDLQEEKYVCNFYRYNLQEDIDPCEDSRCKLKEGNDIYSEEQCSLRKVENHICKESVVNSEEVVNEVHRGSECDSQGVVNEVHRGGECDSQGVVNEVHTNNTHRNNTQLTSNNIYSLVITYLNQKAGTKYKHTTRKTQGFIKARVQEGFTERDFYLVIDKKVSEWNNTEFSKYLRPETLFGNKFEGYLNQGVKDYGKCRGNGSFGSNNEKYKGEQGKFTGYRPPEPVHDGAGDEDTTELI